MAPKPKHIVGTAGAETLVNSGAKGQALAHQASALTPRLLDLPTAAAYLSISHWTLRELEARGYIPRVVLEMPAEAQRRPRNGKHSVGSGVMRKLLFDKQDLDDYVDRSKVRQHGG